jgi:hypothetical protein
MLNKISIDPKGIRVGCNIWGDYVVKFRLIYITLRLLRKTGKPVADKLMSKST